MAIIPLLPEQFEPTQKTFFVAPDSHTHNTLRNISSTLLALYSVALYPLQDPAMLCAGHTSFLRPPTLNGSRIGGKLRIDALSSDDNVYAIHTFAQAANI